MTPTPRPAERSDRVDQALEHVYRSDRGRVLARLMAVLRDFDLAEDALQDAVVSARSAWRTGGVPDNPAGWLVTTARRKALDRIRRAASADRRHRAWAELAIAWDPPEPVGPIRDDRLRLIFICCHPALPMEARVGLTLRSIGGLTTPEVARAFLIPEPTLAQRLVRAKRKIRESGIGYRVPDRDELPGRLGGVLAVIYLIFNAGYLASSGTELIRVDLCDEAIRLSDLVTELLPDEAEPWGLAALLRFQHSRRSARTGPEGQPLTLEEQDRRRWDAQMILAGATRLGRVRDQGPPGPYQLQAEIAAVHAGTDEPTATDWGRIVALYDQLVSWDPTPVVRLNRAVAVAMAERPESGLALLDAPDLAMALSNYHLFHLTRADLLRRAGRLDEAVGAYEEAARHTDNSVERAFVQRRLVEVADRRNAADGPRPS
ncbi:MAG TPA: RNA polymerase sigma factor [Acidimicrobiales bacterium]|nr:RNA polymerase sigma factor [Acidimicrobiales bacterium]